MRCHGQKGVESTLCDIDPVELCGDVKVIFQTATTELFNVWFNTWFVNKDVMTFTMIDFDNDTENSKRFSLTSIPDSVNGLKDVVTDDLHDDNNPSLVQEGEMENISVEALTALENETEATLNLQRRKAPFWYPIHNISLDFKNFDFLCEKLLTFPSNQKFLNIPSYLKDVNHSTRKPLEVSHALLYSIIQLYLRAGFLGRCFDYHIELIYFENKVGIKSFEQQAIELSTIDLTILQPEEFEPFWLNIYHIMLLHGLLYWKHRPIKNFKQLLLDFKNLKYNIGGLSYSLYEILMGNLRAPWPNDNSIGKVIIYQKGDERKKYVIPVADKDIGFLISFGTITSPGIWLYSVDEFNLQKDIAINTYLNRNSAALGDTKVLYIMDNMKLYIKDYGNERQMKNEILKRYNVNNIDNWNLKYQQEDYETRIILDHLIAQNIVITHQDMDYAEQSHLFRYEKPIIKNLNM
ncbi:Phosphatidylinositol 3 [Entamoeba marina]